MVIVIKYQPQTLKTLLVTGHSGLVFIITSVNDNVGLSSITMLGPIHPLSFIVVVIILTLTFLDGHLVDNRCLEWGDKLLYQCGKVNWSLYVLVDGIALVDICVVHLQAYIVL